MRQLEREGQNQERAMTSFTLSVEQLRSAPPEVRRWIENEIAAALISLHRPEQAHAEPHEAGLAACTPEEAAGVFALIKDNFLLAQVFFELGRDLPNAGAAPPLYALNIGELLRHTRIAEGNRLAGCFTAINKAFQMVRNDEQAALFGFDQFGRVYIHQTTHQSIQLVWQQLAGALAAEGGQSPGEPAPMVGAPFAGEPLTAGGSRFGGEAASTGGFPLAGGAPAAGGPAAAAATRPAGGASPFGFTPPHLGPSEDVATHPPGPDTLR
jgi:hypothetical protein